MPQTDFSEKWMFVTSCRHQWLYVSLPLRKIYPVIYNEKKNVYGKICTSKNYPMACCTPRQFYFIPAHARLSVLQRFTKSLFDEVRFEIHSEFGDLILLYTNMVCGIAFCPWILLGFNYSKIYFIEPNFCEILGIVIDIQL